MNEWSSNKSTIWNESLVLQSLESLLSLFSFLKCHYSPPWSAEDDFPLGFSAGSPFLREPWKNQSPRRAPMVPSWSISATRFLGSTSWHPMAPQRKPSSSTWRCEVEPTSQVEKQGLGVFFKTAVVKKKRPGENRWLFQKPWDNFPNFEWREVP